MHDFIYVTKKESMPVKKELIRLINEVQNLVRQNFTFRFDFVGSSKRNMVTYDRKSNIGYDFDVNIEVNDDNEKYSPDKIRSIIMAAINKVVSKYGYDFCEDSTSVLTIKVKNTARSRIMHSCDFAIVYNCENGDQQYIRFNKDNQNYTWEYRGKGIADLSQKIEWIKRNKLWNELKDYYIEKKNNNTNPQKHSRSIFAETVNEICQKNNY
ncbi:MAG: hypothetical protein IKB98_06380 [Clostridia bacterium]|nr:hypothetical protein [Clostridia bacterium]